LLTGRRAFAADSLTAVMYKVVHDDPPPLASLDPSIPPHLQAIVSKATAKDKEARYQEASQMNRDLLAGRAPEVTVPSTVVLGPVAPGTVLVAPEAPPPAGTVMRPQGAVAPAAPAPTPVRARRLRPPVLAAIAAALVLLLGGGAVLVALLLSSSRATVPDLVGVDASEAPSLLEQSGLVMEEEEVSYSGFSEGEVVS
ncbi:MAG: hypothetical protein ACUVT4_12205, partial [Actinomycetota bacterium]